LEGFGDSVSSRVEEQAEDDLVEDEGGLNRNELQ
jgi:hypothetical protein